MRNRRFIFCFSILLGMLWAASPADAQRRKKKRVRHHAPNEEAIDAAFGELKWGMSKKEVIEHFVKEIREKYRKPLATAPGAIEEDRMRRKMNVEIRKVHNSITKFDGNKTGWDVSFLRGEFTHRNNEEMIVIRDENSQNYYFFINDKLWKWYKAFKSEVFAGRPFDDFAAALEARYGRAARKKGTLEGKGAEERQWLEWQGKETRVRAIDENEFYGFYCLVFEDLSTLRQLPNLRTNKQGTRSKAHSIVDSVTTDEEPTQEHSNVVDRITGKIRSNQAPAK